ncbi:MAG TPA: fibronectin type III domain-containing protein, partial [Candidatus Angelobacter sp.]
QEETSPAVKIIHGPVVELITDSTAQIAWSTNVNAGTVLHYGTDPQKLDQTAGMPWGGLTHRVVLRRLNPSTTYYFQAESPQGQDTGTRAEAAASSFKTVAEGDPPVRNKQP